MKIATEYIEYLCTLGFSKDKLYYNGVDSYLESVDIHNPYTGQVVWLLLEPTEKWVDYVESLSNGVEFEQDLSEYIVTGIMAEGDLCTERNFCDGSNKGICLVNNTDSYYTHLLTDENFKKAVWIQSHQYEHMVSIIKSYLHNFDLFKEKIAPVFEKYDFYEEFNSLIHCCEYDERQEDSNITSIFNHPNNKIIHVITDVFDGHMIISGFENVDFESVTKEEVEQLFIKNILLDEDGRPDLKFSYLLNDDPKDTIDSYKEVMHLFYLKRYGEDINNVNKSIIPDEYQYLFD